MNDLKKRAEKIAELAAQAVPGPWIAAGPSWGADKPIWLNSVVVDTDDDSSEEVCRLRDVDDNMRDATCEFIAAAPEMAQLIADQQAEIARLRRAAKSKKCRWTDGPWREAERFRLALAEIREEWAGAECGIPVTAQEAYAIQLARRLYEIAAGALSVGLKR